MTLAADILGTWHSLQRDHDDPPDVRSVPLAVRDGVGTLVDAAALVVEARTIAAGRSVEEQRAVEAAAQFWLEWHGLPFTLFGCPELPAAEPCAITTAAVFERLMWLRLPAPVRH